MAGEAAHYLAYTKKLTNVSMLLALVMGVGLTSIMYAIIIFSLEDFQYIPVHTFFVGQGSIPYLSTWAFWTAMSGLLLKTIRIKHELRGFAVAERLLAGSSANAESSLGPDSAKQLLIRVVQLNAQDKNLMVVNRVEKALHRLVNTRSTAEVGDVLQAQSDVDKEIVESSYTFVKFLSGVIPILGFLGTVFGIGIAITEFTKILETASSFDAVKPALGIATYNLGVAFNTTLVALTFSGFILLLNAVIQKREEDLLSAVDGYCIDRLISRVRVVSSDTAELKEAIDRGSDLIVRSLEAQTSTTEASVQEALDHVTSQLRTSQESLEKRMAGTAEELVKEIKATRESLDSEGMRDAVHNAVDLVEARSREILDQLTGRSSELVAEIKTLRDSLGDLAASAGEAVGRQGREVQERLGEIAAQSRAPAELLERLGSQVDGLARGVESLRDLEGALGSLGEIGKVVQELGDVVARLRPAMENLSAEMAEKVNKVLVQLLKVNVIVHRLDRLNPEEIKYYHDLKFDEILNKVFRVDGA